MPVGRRPQTVLDSLIRVDKAERDKKDSFKLYFGDEIDLPAWRFRMAHWEVLKQLQVPGENPEQASKLTDIVGHSSRQQALSDYEHRIHMLVDKYKVSGPDESFSGSDRCKVETPIFDYMQL